MKLRIKIVLGLSHTVAEFDLPDSDVSAGNAIEMGRKLADTINELRPKIKTHEELTLKTCDCFWKDKSPKAREYNTCHSSECAVWNLPSLKI